MVGGRALTEASGRVDRQARGAYLTVDRYGVHVLRRVPTMHGCRRGRQVACGERWDPHQEHMKQIDDPKILYRDVAIRDCCLLFLSLPRRKGLSHSGRECASDFQFVEIWRLGNSVP